MSLDVLVDAKGTLKFVYNDALKPLLTLGEGKIRRASHVEPTSDNRWTADMAPVGGPILGPYATRAEALEHEVDWLRANLR